MLPFISCLCPTYKRPDYLANAVACFIAQDYPVDRRELIVCDDAGQFYSQNGPNWFLFSAVQRVADTLPGKYNWMASLADARADIICPWEDDDIYLSGHLRQIAEAGGDFITPTHVWSTYNEPDCQAHREEAHGRFHGAWAFTRKLFDEVGGYPKTKICGFDQKTRSLLLEHTTETKTTTPTYVYRFDTGIYQTSSRGEEGYAEHWASVEKIPAPWLGTLHPKFDNETESLYKQLAGVTF
jgi:glycosyltransferase involved in cell wall biosynthesis|tara:strand:+ start:1396 stop:2115 length:720 start_codon:yes stop_codon:yes gene_type:complete